MRRLGIVLAVVSAFALQVGLVAAASPEGHFSTTTGTVLDAATQLTWERRPSTSTYTLTQAEQHCAALDVDGKGWRLPTVLELLSLVDETRGQPAIDTQAFPGTASDYYWTSSSSKMMKNAASAVSFRFGFDGQLAVDTTQRVRCVR